MNFNIYNKNNFKCLIPDYCKVKSDAPQLTVVSKNQKKKQTFLTIQINPDDSIIEGIETQILHWVATNDEQAERKIIQRGEFNSKWSGIELFTEIKWLHNNSIEYGWWLVLDVDKNKVCIQLAFIGDVNEDKNEWLKVFDSMEIK